MQQKIVSIGSDPELFVFRDNKPISSIGIFPGSKEEPHMISNHESVQVDNVALEFNLKPCKEAIEMFNSMAVCYNWSMEHLAKIDKKMYIQFAASVEFDDEELSHPDAKRFGCEPDFNAWKESVRQFRRPKNKNLRSCGGHLHIGVSEPFLLDINRFVRLLDKHVGTYTSEICGDERRRILYGKAGSYRIKDYGVEYRTPSNKWLSKLEYMEEVFRLTNKALEDYNDYQDASPEIEHIINSTTIKVTV